MTPRCVIPLVGLLSLPSALLAQGVPPGPTGKAIQRVLHFIEDNLTDLLALYILVPLLIILLAIVLRRTAGRRIQDPEKQYSVRKLITRLMTGILVLYLGFVVLLGTDAANVATVVGLLGAGIAVALQDIIASFVAWFFILGSRGFKIGDRIRIGDVKGDVVDIGVLRTSVLSVQNVGDVEGQATGSLRVFPNSLVLKIPLENYTIGNEYVWNEINFLITYESNWKRAEGIVLAAADVIDVEHIVDQARRKMQLMRRDFRVRVGALTPIVYVKAADSGVFLTLRYLCGIRQVRSTSDRITREVMTHFFADPDIAFAYPTMRIVPTPPEPRNPSPPNPPS